MSLVSLELFFPELKPLLVRLSAGERAVELALSEFHCADPNCDCERVSVQFTDPVTGEILATINHDFRASAEDGERASVDPAGSRSDLSADLVDLFRTQILTPEYEARLQRHAAMVRESVVENPRLRRVHRGGMRRQNELAPGTDPTTRPMEPKTGPTERRSRRDQTMTRTVVHDPPSTTLTEFARPLISKVGPAPTLADLEFCYRVATIVWNALVDGTPAGDVAELRALLPVLGRRAVIRIWKMLKGHRTRHFAHDDRKFVSFEVQIAEDGHRLRHVRVEPTRKREP